MKCPRDNSELKKEIYEANIEIDVCESCGGKWLDKGELETIQKTIEKDYSNELGSIPSEVIQEMEKIRQQNQGIIKCPKCKVDMELKEAKYNSKMLIDVCNTCGGVWLDDGELKTLEKYFEKTHPEKKGFFKSLISGFLD